MSIAEVLRTVILFLVVLSLLPVAIGGITRRFTRYVEKRSLVAIVEIKGVLCDARRSCLQLHKYFKDPKVKGVVLKIESPGGAAGTAQTIFTEILELKKKYHKPVVALVENICASGGYYVSVAADYIVSPGAAMVGSIGVTLPYLFQLKELIEHHKIKYVSIKAGAHKSMTDPFVEMSVPDKKVLQAVVDDTQAQFIADVSAQRHLDPVKSESWAEGKIFTARQAKALGLIDEIGSLSSVVTYMKDKALLSDEIEWIYTKKRSGLGALFGSDEETDEENSFFATTAEQLVSFLRDTLCTQAFFQFV